MRRKETHLQQPDTRRLFNEIEVLSLSSTDSEGRALHRFLHGALLDETIVFHGAKAGQSSEILGRDALVSVAKPLASIPSYFTDRDHGCPATTYYESAEAQGKVEVISDLEEKARCLQALMDKYQPEGKFLPFADYPEMYKKNLRGVQVYCLRVQSMTGKRNIGQKNSDEDVRKILNGLWGRGKRLDLQMIDILLTEKKAAKECVPVALQCLPGMRFVFQPGHSHALQVAGLLQGSYWNEGISEGEIISSHMQSRGWLCVEDESGEVVASGRALGDWSKYAHIFDLIVKKEFRSRGLGSRLFSQLLQHPALRNCRKLRLGTKDAVGFYEKFGFTSLGTEAKGIVQMQYLR